MSSKTEEPVQHVNTNIRMSRGLEKEPEYEVPFHEVEECVLLDENGQKVKFGGIYAKQKTIVIFVRHFLCFTCKEYVDDLAKIPAKVLKDANIRLVVIGNSEYRFIKPFRKETGFKHEMYVDPPRELYKKMGCLTQWQLADAKKSKHIKSGTLMGTLKSTWRAMQSEKYYQGDMGQQGGSFIIGPGDVCEFSHIDKNSSDHCSINKVLFLAGAEKVSFELDQQVFVI